MDSVDSHDIIVSWEWDVRLRTYVTRFSKDRYYIIRYIEEPWDELSPAMKEFYMSDVLFRLEKDSDNAFSVD